MSGIWYRVMGAGITRENSTQLSNEFSSDQYTQDYIHITSHTRGGASKNSRLSNSRDLQRSPIFALYLCTPISLPPQQLCRLQLFLSLRMQLVSFTGFSLCENQLRPFVLLICYGPKCFLERAGEGRY